jgi:hypothetical protein
MNEHVLQIISASFELLQSPLGPGWVMRITGIARNIQHRALPFRARVGDQGVEGLTVASAGDRFDGFLRRIPDAGDRLYVGYASATIPTAIVYQPSGPPVA